MHIACWWVYDLNISASMYLRNASPTVGLIQCLNSSSWWVFHRCLATSRGNSCWNTQHESGTNLLNVPVIQKKSPRESNTEHLTWILKTENHLDIAIESPCTIFGWRCPDDRDHLSLFATSSRRVSRYRPSKAWENCPVATFPPVLSCASCWNGDLQTKQHVWVWMVMVGVQP